MSDGINRLTVGSLFTGIGGIDLGLEGAGMEIVWQVEIDEDCRKLLEYYWPGVVRYGDISKIDWDEVERVDVVCGGFPCPPVSTAGNRRGRDDDRWLWPEFVRCIRAIKPKWVLVENVRGLLSVGSGREFGEILRDLAKIRYDAEWFVLGARDVGASQKRERVFILAYPKCNGRGSANKSQSEGNRKTIKEKCPGRDAEEYDRFVNEGYSVWSKSGVVENRLPKWPPHPEDEEGWGKIIERHPELAPGIITQS